MHWGFKMRDELSCFPEKRIQQLREIADGQRRLAERAISTAELYEGEADRLEEQLRSKV